MLLFGLQVFLCYLFVCAFVDANADETVLGPPENLTVLHISDRSADLQWSQPRDGNSEIRGYRVYFMNGNFTSVRTFHSSDSTNKLTLQGLEPNSQYKVWTKAFTQSIEGKSSTPVVVMTDFSAPGPPIIGNATCQDDVNLYLHWFRPVQVYGSVDLYFIYFRPEESSEFVEITVNSVYNRMEYNFLLVNLTQNTIYEVKIRGGTYSRVIPDKIHKGLFSITQKVQLIYNCHKESAKFFPFGFEFSAAIVTGTICATSATFILVIAMLVWRHFFTGKYYYLDDPPKVPPVLVTDWENETEEGDHQFGPIDVRDFAKHVAELHADGDIGFSKEYEAIQAASTQDQHLSEYSQFPENKQKNRYLNIVAYDHSRVQLRPPSHKRSSEYINANYIDGYGKCCAYIGTQGPLPSTFDTFWQMVWEQRVHIIVMITNLVERGRKKCDQYWPKEGHETYGMFQVSLVHEDVFATHTIRKFSLAHMKLKSKRSLGERIVYQYHYTNWPDHGTPDHPLPVLAFVRKSANANPDDAGPIVVHCSAGVGRTGTYIVIDVMLKLIHHKNRLNILGFLKHIRTQRNFLVQTEEQYIFIHDSLLEAISSGDTCVPKCGLGRYIRTLQADGGNAEKPQSAYLLHHQHKMVTEFTPQDFNMMSSLKPVNIVKNRSSDFLPMEAGRVHLTPKPGVDGSDYISATWLIGYQKLDEYIVTPHPMVDTILDFWQMVWDHNAQTVAVLTSVDDENGWPQFWPPQGEDFNSQQWKVSFMEEKFQSSHTIVEVTMQSVQDDYELPVRLILAPGWPQILPESSNRLSLVTLAHEVHTNYQNGPLIIVDRYGGTEAATFCTLATLKHQVQYEQCIDAYMYFKLYHIRRPNIWQSEEDLLFVYQTMESFVCEDGSKWDSCNDIGCLDEPVISLPLMVSYDMSGDTSHDIEQVTSNGHATLVEIADVTVPLYESVDFVALESVILEGLTPIEEAPPIGLKFEERLAIEGLEVEKGLSLEGLTIERLVQLPEIEMTSANIIVDLS